MKILIISMLLLLTGCSEPEVVIDHEYMSYYTGRIGLVSFSQEVCQ